MTPKEPIPNGFLQGNLNPLPFRSQNPEGHSLLSTSKCFFWIGSPFWESTSLVQVVAVVFLFTSFLGGFHGKAKGHLRDPGGWLPEMVGFYPDRLL